MTDFIDAGNLEHSSENRAISDLRDKSPHRLNTMEMAPQILFIIFSASQTNLKVVR